MLLFGRKLVPAWVHFFAGLMVTAGTLFSTFWILSVNSWMQTPQGFHVEDGRYDDVSPLPLTLFGIPDDASGSMRDVVEIPGLGSPVIAERWFGWPNTALLLPLPLATAAVSPSASGR